MIDRLTALGVVAGRKALQAVTVGHDKPALKMCAVSDLVVPGPTGDLNGRLYVPGDAAPGSPLMIYWHGGGFTFCDSGTHDALCRRLAHGSGVTILSVEYRLAPEHAWPAQIEDAMAAARWVLEREALTAPGPATVLLGGDSAGGYLALSCARALNRERPGTVPLTCLIYPLLHLEDEIWATENAGLRRIGRAAVGIIRTRLVSSPPNLLETDASEDPPCVLTYGGPADPVSPDCRTYQAMLERIGTPVRARCFTPLPHGYANMTHLIPAARTAVDSTAGLLGEAVRELYRSETFSASAQTG
ncbi:alpha/beta hydrolase [Brevundimonas sp.]|uniref:alpha/beta hydrolase n=1 Tax=Brevundimonas sp. TaxID=1871086 RepID=UPI0025FF1183|nr:alpha/beta hydrolase [Brevundimonas sp.]